MTARQTLLDGLARDAWIFERASELAPLHPRDNTFPGEVFLHLAADALGSVRGQPVRPAGLGGTARAVPARVHVPRPGKIRSSSTRCWPRRPSMAGPNRICWMRSPGGRPMTSGSTACSRRSATSAPPRAGRACRCVRHARTWPGALATQRNDDQFRRLWKRSSDGGAADHDGYCQTRLQWWSCWPRGCTTMAGHRRPGRCVACRCQLLVLAGARPDVGCLKRSQAHRFCLGAAKMNRAVRWHE